MKKALLPVCLLCTLATSVVSFAAEKKAPKPELRGSEKVVLACLGMIGTEKPARIARAEALLAMQDEKDMLRPLATALTCNPPSLRVYAAGRLAQLGRTWSDGRAARPLLHKVVREPVARVRRAMVAALRRIGAPDSVHVLGRALASRDSRVVRRAAEALGELGDELALPYVIKKWSGRAGDFPRVYFTQVNQRSYIRDFDVEVAATSFIADPIIGISQEGMVQPVKIIATEQTEVGIFHAALVKLAGRDLGRSVGAWQRYWNENRARVQRERAARTR